MKNICIAACALNQTPLDWEGNLERIKKAIQISLDKKASIICLPELCITGYSCEDAFLSRHVQKTAEKYLFKIIELLKEKEFDSKSFNTIITVGLPLLVQNTLYNAVAVICRHKVCGFVLKQHLASDGIHYEPRWFKPWPANEKTEIEINNSLVPIGDLIFEKDSVKIGFEICESAWAVDRPAANLARHGVDIILNPSASHFAFGKHKIREQFIIEGSRAARCTYVYSNLLGNEAGRTIFEGDNFIASGGKMIATGPRLSFDDIVVTTAVVDIDYTKTLQLSNGSFRPLFNKKNTIKISGSVKDNIISKKTDNLLHSDDCWNKCTEFERAEALALYDYMRKSCSNGFVVSLSGGADSAAVCCLIYLMRELSGIKTEMKDLLTCVYQSSENSSEITYNAAKNLANQLGASFHSWQISSLIKQYCELAEQTIERPLNWNKDDITLQNIQARVRCPGVWMIANIKNALLICTSNRSESAVGYCTSEGDLAGGLAPLAGIDKPFLIQWLDHYIEKKYRGAKAIDEIIDRKPTAELRPGNQSDEDDLMPYEILDAIEENAIRDKKSPLEIFKSLQSKFVHNNTELGNYIEKFFKLWIKNQWKREKTPVSFHLDDENLDPKTWCRWPVLCSDMKLELNEMWQYIRTEFCV